MILIDTSVWIRKLAGREPFASGLDRLLSQHRVAAHAFVAGELLMGSRSGSSREPMLAAYALLPWIAPMEHHQVVAMVKARRLAGERLGWMDAHLLASALNAGCRLWTADDALARAALAAGIAWQP